MLCVFVLVTSAAKTSSVAGIQDTSGGSTVISVTHQGNDWTKYFNFDTPADGSSEATAIGTSSSILLVGTQCRNGVTIHTGDMKIWADTSSPGNTNCGNTGAGDVAYCGRCDPNEEGLCTWAIGDIFMAGNVSCETASATAIGDPHLSNIQGKKFDVHDGWHRLVHFPRGASESEALLKIDAHASMMPGQKSCYNVFFTSATLSGKWVGNDVLLQHDSAPMGKKRFVLGMNGKFYDWADLTQNDSNLGFSGIEPVHLSTRARNASLHIPGGDDVEFSIGHQHPVLVQVWASRGANVFTDHKDIQYLNLEVQNLPENTGGLLGLDTYIRPAGSKCGMAVLLAVAQNAKQLQWRISANARK